MTMRAPKNEASGTAGQSFVKGQFEELGWGAVPNPEHDLGTDLWLMARDLRRFDLKALVGAQVKTGVSYFQEPEVDDNGDVVGWWFREEDDSHFDYWCDHSVPHILVLHNLELKASFWAQLVRESVVSTGKGNKILVPATSKVDLDHFKELADAATATFRTPQWEGSVWEVGQQIPESAQLRYALITPRLVAPHPSKGFDDLDPHQAIALLVQVRLRDLQGRSPGKKVVDLDAARQAPEWEWRLFAALHDWLTDGQLDGLLECVSSATSTDRRVAAIICAAFAHLERGEIASATGFLEPELAGDAANPVDHAWLQAHLAQCFLELGRLTEARELALKVQGLRKGATSDPTALAIVAAAGYTLFTASDWEGRNLAELVQSNDTAATWWRSQTLATGLGRHFDETFKQWAGDSSVTFNAQDEASTKLRSAMLLSGFPADRSAWSHAASLLARRQLMTASDEGSPVWALNLLRLSGNDKLLKQAVARLLQVGPVSPLVKVGKELDLDHSTRTSLHSDLSFVQAAADVLDGEDCDRHARWGLAVLRDADALRRHLHPQFLVEDAVLRMLGELVQSSSRDVRHAMMDHLVTLPTVEDQLTAQGFGRLLSRIPENEWSDFHIATLLERDVEDNFELRDAIDRLLASKNPDFRAKLLDRVQAGDLQALASYGNVTDIPTDVVASMIMHLTEAVMSQIDDARRGTFGLGGHDQLGALVLLNLWHPDVAQWSAVEAALALPNSHPSHLEGGIRRLGQLAEKVPEHVRARLEPHLKVIAERKIGDAADRFFESVDVRGEAALAVALLFPDEFSDSSLRTLACGEPSQRVAAVKILVARRDDSQLNLLAVLAQDPDIDVRAASAEGLANWVAKGIAMPGSSGVLEHLLAEAGTRLGVRISRALMDESLEPEPIRLLVDLLQKHPSAVVRARSKLAQTRTGFPQVRAGSSA